MAKILLVEDDKSLREIYGVRLMAEGYTIVSAGDGEEALAVAIKERPDLIVSDVMMPKISGFDMLDILRSTTETKAIKVIMMTALSSEDQRARGEALGADRYLVKSQVGIEDVVRTVHDVLGDNLTSAAPTPDFSQPAPVAAVPSAEPTPAPVAPAPSIPEATTTPAPVASIPAPTPIETPMPTAPAEPIVAAPAPYETPVAPVTEPVTPITAEQPVINTPPTPAPIAPAPSAPEATPIAEPAAPTLNAAYQPEPAAPIMPAAPPTTPMPEPTTPVEPVFAPAPPTPIAPEPSVPTPAPYTPPAPAPAPNVTLPEPTAPFSSPRPASLGDRVINPLPSAESLGQPGPADIATQMNQELENHLQGLPPVEAPVQTQPPAPQLPPFPPQPTV